MKNGNTKYMYFNLRNICRVVKKNHSRFSLFEELSHQRTTFSKYDLLFKSKIEKLVLGWERCENIFKVGGNPIIFTGIAYMV